MLVYLDDLITLEPRMSGWSDDHNMDLMHFQHYPYFLVIRISTHVEIPSCLGNWDPCQENVTFRESTLLDEDG